AQWAMSLCYKDPDPYTTACGTGTPLTVDITPRRVQQFPLVAGAEYTWENRRVVDGGLVNSGVVTANGSRRLTVPAFQLEATGGNRLILPAFGALTGGLDADENYVKRAEGVLWELLSPNPVMFSAQVAAVPGIENAVIKRTGVKIDQAGMPATVRLVHGLLIRSQVQSLVLAISVVLVMVSLAHLSLRRGFTSMLTVLVPLVFILGFMGLMDMPLDIGTVLCGSLIVGLGIDGSIHFLHYYSRIHAGGVPKEQAIRMTLGHVGKAVCTANGTTFSGFVVCLLSDVTAVKNFATLNSIAIVLVTLSIMTLLPALVTVLHLDSADDRERPADDEHAAVFRHPATSRSETRVPGRVERKTARVLRG
ncbi:MAG TPA: MMPL family transporter, partial [Deltaproteobacteria bacterium]|nr:MMPL family transporter [Deltaproteobacteria bacterium]